MAGMVIARRRRGTGTIEPMPDGTFRPRLPGAGGRLRPCATREEAVRLLDAAMAELAAESMVHPEGLTLRAFGLGFLDRREKTHANARDDRSTWATCVMIATFADWPLASITPIHVREHRDRLLATKARPGNGQVKRKTKVRTLSRRRVQNAINLLRVALGEAVERGLIASNPAEGVRLPRALGVTRDPWTYLVPDEQARFLDCADIPQDDRDLYRFAIGTGMRESEVWNLHLADLRGVRVTKGVVEIDADAVVIVRYGGHGKATKGQRIRYVPIFGLARAALVSWLPRLASRPNPSGLVWPLRGGERRWDGKAPRHWRAHLAAAGLDDAAKRHDGQAVRFHDLRHTCASSLVAGWWGRRWSLEEVKGLLGHRSITTTERYAHLAESALQVAARSTAGSIHDPSTAAPK